MVAGRHLAHPEVEGLHGFVRFALLGSLRGPRGAHGRGERSGYGLADVINAVGACPRHPALLAGMLQAAGRPCARGPDASFVLLEVLALQPIRMLGSIGGNSRGRAKLGDLNLVTRELRLAGRRSKSVGKALTHRKLRSLCATRREA